MGRIVVETLLALFSSLTFEKIATIKVGSQPKAVQLTPDQRLAVVTNFGGGSLSIINADSFTVRKTLRLDGNPVEVDFRTDSAAPLVPNSAAPGVTSFAYISDFTNSIIWEMSLADFSIQRKFAAGIIPKVVKVLNNKTLFAANWVSGSVSVIDIASGKEIKEIKVGKTPRGMVFSQDGKKLYVCNFETASNSISIIDTDSLKVTKTLKGFRHNPRHAAITPDGKKVYVAVYYTGYVYVIDTTPDTIIGRIKCKDKVKTLEVSPDGRFLYVAVFGDKAFEVIDAGTDSIIATVDAGRAPCGLDISKDGNYIWVTNWDDNTVMVFRKREN